jgi:hypothetical protein
MHAILHRTMWNGWGGQVSSKMDLVLQLPDTQVCCAGMRRHVDCFGAFALLCCVAGPRGLSWRDDKPAELSWIEAQV